jgi:phosphoribosylformylglycinamidine (FGAM) synthase-like amidotransferase family enzyme
MPHPERAMSTLLGSDDGRILMESFVTAPVASLVP